MSQGFDWLRICGTRWDINAWYFELQQWLILGELIAMSKINFIAKEVTPTDAKCSDIQ